MTKLTETTKEDIQRDMDDWNEAFGSYRGLTPSSLTPHDMINWMNTVTDDLGRLNKKVAAIIKHINGIEE